MNTQHSCPEVEQLRRLLDDALPPEEAGPLGRHIDQCESCQRSLDQLTAAESPLQIVARHAASAAAAEPALQHAIRQLSNETRTAAQAVMASERTETLDFLTPSDNPDHLGRLGHYTILSLLGRGGMGVVLKAFDPELKRIVAIKVLAPELATNVLARKRFIREAQAAAGISHEHVVTIHAVDEIHGLPLIVMQYIEGRSLHQRLETAEALGIPELLRIARQTVAGLAAAHAQGLIHRDIKPANILLEAAAASASAGAGNSLAGAVGCGPSVVHERVKITDFGLARAIDDGTLSQSGIVAGTPLYMSPEQFSGTGIDQRSDLYAVGILLYRLAAGREPFIGNEVNALRTQHLYDRPQPPSEVARQAVPHWLEELILKLLQKDPADRPQTAEEIIQLLDRGWARAALLPQEEARLAALHRYRILDTDPEQSFDDLTFMASYVCGTPIALITLVDADRQWFKAKVGMSLKETARDISFCTHTIREAQPMVVRDALEDDRFAGSPLVRSEPHVRFYAGIPLTTPDGHALGALCVFDRAPRQLTPDQMSALASLSRLVMAHLELRRNLLELKDALAASDKQPR